MDSEVKRGDDEAKTREGAGGGEMQGGDAARQQRDEQRRRRRGKEAARQRRRIKIARRLAAVAGPRIWDISHVKRNIDEVIKGV
ncbi:hypothetical protein Scep_015957 [Stephania cephalantha]|uniref:Uncharacterized protein n=1 Tax=Stephania cephalantha TaxID=152367 RepID=A0AAP0NTS2_9MAGN